MLIDRKFVYNGKLYREDASGNVYVWQSAPGLGELGGFWKKIKSVHKKIHKAVVKVVKAPIKLEKKIRSEILRSKIGRAVVTGVGAAFAPFTGGTSLAAAQALTRYGKARYGQGLSRSEAYKSGARGAAIGYVAGVGLVYGAGSVGIGRAATPGLAPSFFTPFGTAAAPATVSAGSPLSRGFYSGYTGTVAAPAATSAATAAAAPGAGLFSKVGAFLTTIGKTATAVLPLAQVAAMRNAAPVEPFDASMMAAGAPYAGAYSEDYGGGGGGGGGGGAPNMPAEIDPETGEPIEKPAISPAMLGVLSAGVLLATTMSGGRRSRKRTRRNR